MENRNLAAEIFANEELENVRKIVKDGEVLFLGTDVAEVLGFSSAPEQYVDAICENIVKVPMRTKDGIEIIKYITEGDIYRMVRRSSAKLRKEFEDWLYDEVLPTIRKHGAYIAKDIDTEYVNNEIKFGERRVVDAFAECENADEAEKLYDEFREYVDDEYENDDEARLARYEAVGEGLSKLHTKLAKNIVHNLSQCYLTLLLKERVELDRTEF